MMNMKDSQPIYSDLREECSKFVFFIKIFKRHIDGDNSYIFN